MSDIKRYSLMHQVKYPYLSFFDVILNSVQIFEMESKINNILRNIHSNECSVIIPKEDHLSPSQGH